MRRLHLKVWRQRRTQKTTRPERRILSQLISASYVLWEVICDPGWVNWQDSLNLKNPSWSECSPADQKLFFNRFISCALRFEVLRHHFPHPTYGYASNMCRPVPPRWTLSETFKWFNAKYQSSNGFKWALLLELFGLFRSVKLLQEPSLIIFPPFL